MERKYNALSLRNVDYSESDKIVTLLTLERGKIVMRARGCRNANAKLRCAVSPLCFGLYILNESKGRFVLTGCDIIDTFEKISENIDKYYVAMIILEAANKFSEENVADEDFFMLIIKSLKNLCYGEFPQIMGITFLLDLLEKLGYAISVTEGDWFDFENGSFEKKPLSRTSQKLSKVEKSVISDIANNGEDIQEELLPRLKRIYLLLDNYLAYVTQKKLVTIKEYITSIL